MAREIAGCLKKPERGDGFIKTAYGIVTWLVSQRSARIALKTVVQLEVII